VVKDPLRESMKSYEKVAQRHFQEGTGYQLAEMTSMPKGQEVRRSEKFNEMRKLHNDKMVGVILKEDRNTVKKKKFFATPRRGLLIKAMPKETQESVLGNKYEFDPNQKTPQLLNTVTG